MKTFTDPLSIKLQEDRDAVEFVRRVDLLHQYSGAIKSVPVATDLVVAGNTSGVIGQNDTIVLPVDDFEAEHVVTGIVYNSGTDETTITASASTFTAGVIGLHVARKIVVSGGDSEFLIEMSPVRYEIEGDTLNEWLASEIELNFDNDGTFANAANTGLLDNTDVFWVRVYFGWKGASDRLLYFGGLVDRDGIEDDRGQKQFRVTCYGHLKELERNPAWLLNDPLRKLLTVRGLEIAKVIDLGSAPEGVRKLSFHFPARNFLSALTIQSISQDTPEGYHVIKFRPPDLWQYDYGAWGAQTVDTDVTLTSAQGHTINFKTPKDFDFEPRYMLFLAEDTGAEVKPGEARGTATLRLGNGSKVDIEPDFSHVVHFNGTVYSDVTAGVTNDFRNGVILLDSVNDEIYFLAYDKFRGLEFTLKSTGIGGSLVYEYSQGFNAWGALPNLVDGTGQFFNDGLLSWDLPADWQKVDLEFGGSVGTVENVFAMRIRLTVHVSASVEAFFVRRLLRVVSDDNLALDVRINMAALETGSFQEDVIALDDGAGNLVASTWQANLSAEKLTTNILDLTGYPAAKRTLDAMKYTLTAPVIGNLGRPPLPFSRKRCNAIVVDTSTSPETVYLGVGDEIWKVTDSSDYIFIDRVNGSGDYELEIFALAIDDNGFLQGVARKKYDRVITGGATAREKRGTPAVVFRSTSKTAITEQTELLVSGNSPFYSGEVCYRAGRSQGVGFAIGVPQTNPAGENIAFPFDQNSFGIVDKDDPSHNFGKCGGLTSSTTTSASVNPNSKIKFGFYRTAFLSDDLLRFELGQPGLCLWDEEADRWLFNYIDASVERLSFVDYLGTITTHILLSDKSTQALAGCVDGSANAYLAEMIWDSQLGSFPLNLSDCRLRKADLSIVGNYTTVFDFSADSIELSQSLSGNHDTWPKIRACTITDLCFNAAENSIHGCIYDRFDLTYHWFVYDIALDKLYSSQTGIGFDFNEGMQPKGFVYNSQDSKVYAVFTDRRYGEAEAFLVKADFSSARAAGSEIEMTFCAQVLPKETDLRGSMAMGGGGRVYGISAPDQNALFQYDDVFFPRVFVANFDDATLREALSNAVQIVNYMIHSRSERKIRVVGRENFDGSKVMLDGKHVLSVEPLATWRHFYDRVEVDWQNPITGESGVAAAGTGGWQRRVLKIGNPLVQSRSLAEVIAAELLIFFNQYKQVIEADLIAQLELEEFDRLQFFLQTFSFDIDRTQWWKLTSLEFDPESLALKIRGLT